LGIFTLFGLVCRWGVWEIYAVDDLASTGHMILHTGSIGGDVAALHATCVGGDVASVACDVFYLCQKVYLFVNMQISDFCCHSSLEAAYSWGIPSAAKCRNRKRPGAV
jgi:hypothetical protein